MKKNTVSSLILITLLVLVATTLITPLLAQAQEPGLQNVDAPEGTPGGSDLLSRIRTIINALLIFVAILALIYVIIGGVRYILSQGDQEKTVAARRTILYAIIGLIIIALAAVIINFVLGFIGDPSNTGGPNPIPLVDPVAPQGFLNVTCVDDYLCKFDAASFDPNGTASYQYDWNFGDTSSETTSVATIEHRYAEQPNRTYAVSVSVSGEGGEGTATANARPSQKAFVIDVTCQELSCTLDAQTISGALSFQWAITSEAFVDITETSNPVLAYEVPRGGDYTFALTAVFADGSTFETSTTETVTDAAFAANAEFRYFCSNLTCTFNGTDSKPSDPAGYINDYAWELEENAGFQPGSSTLVHPYDKPGNYEVTLKVTDSLGASGTSDTLTVSPRVNVFPTAAFGQPSCAPTLQGMSCVFDAVSVDNPSIDPDGSIDAYIWDFGVVDAPTGFGPTPTYTYAHPGSYDVTLTVIDNQGAADTKEINVSIIASDPVPFIVPEPDCLASSSDPLPLSLDTTCRFDSHSHDPDGGPVTLQWRVDENGIGPIKSTSTSFTHTFDTPGPHTIHLKVTDDEGETAATSLSFTVTGSPPVATITVVECDGIVNVVCAFSSSESYDPDGPGLTLLTWKVDGVTHFSTTNPLSDTINYTFPTSGSHTIRLDVTDVEDKTAFAELTITFTFADANPNPPLTIVFPPPQCTNLICPFNVSVTGGNASYRYEWDPPIGAGTFSSGNRFSAAPTFEYFRSGTPNFVSHGVTVEVWDANDVYATAFRQVEVTDGDGNGGGNDPPGNQAPIPRIQYDCSGDDCFFDGEASSDDGDFLTYAWDFDNNRTDNFISGSEVERITVVVLGEFTVKLRVTDDEGASSIAKETLTIGYVPGNPAPIANFFNPSCSDADDRVSCIFDPDVTTGAGGSLFTRWSVNRIPEASFGYSSDPPPFTYEFPGPGLYPITLEVAEFNSNSIATIFRWIQVP